jgi:hypothetical protein
MNGISRRSTFIEFHRGLMSRESNDADAMTAIPQPRRRRWKLWAIGSALVLTVIGGVSWYLSGPDEFIRRAQALALGQTREEVRQIMGRESARIVHDGVITGALFGPGPNSLRKKIEIFLAGCLNRPVRLLGNDEWSVQVRFDAKGRVIRMKRGSEIIESKQ